MLKVLAEIMNIHESDIKIENEPDLGHYIRTPYSYSYKAGKKYIPPLHTDLGYGLLEMVKLLNKEI